MNMYSQPETSEDHLQLWEEKMQRVADMLDKRPLSMVKKAEMKMLIRSAREHLQDALKTDSKK